MKEILHQSIGSLSLYLQWILRPRWCKIFFHQQYHTFTNSQGTPLWCLKKLSATFFNGNPFVFEGGPPHPFPHRFSISVAARGSDLIRLYTEGTIGLRGGQQGVAPMDKRKDVLPSLLEPFKRGLGPNKYPLYKVYIGLIIKGTIPKVPAFSLWSLGVPWN